MNDKKALKEASEIRTMFWGVFEDALEPKKCSKRAYLEALEELLTDTKMRIECVETELAEEESQ